MWSTNDADVTAYDMRTANKHLLWLGFKQRVRDGSVKSHGGTKAVESVTRSCTDDADVPRRVSEYRDDLDMVVTIQHRVVHLQQLITSLQTTRQVHRTVRKNGPDVVVWVDFHPVFYVDRSFQTDAETTALLELAHVRNLYTINTNLHLLKM